MPLSIVTKLHGDLIKNVKKADTTVCSRSASRRFSHNTSCLLNLKWAIENECQAINKCQGCTCSSMHSQWLTYSHRYKEQVSVYIPSCSSEEMCFLQSFFTTKSPPYSRCFTTSSSSDSFSILSLTS